MFDRLIRRRPSNWGEQRAISFQQVWGSGGSLTRSTAAGVPVDGDASFGLSAVWACVSLIADSVSTLPVRVMRREGGGVRQLPRPVWLDNPQADRVNYTSADHFYAVIVSMLLHGNAYVSIVRNGLGDPVELHVLNPQDVEVFRRGDGRVAYRVQSSLELEDGDVIHVLDNAPPGSLTGRARVESLREMFGLTLAVQEFAARFFGDGSTLSGVIEFPGALTAEQAKELQAGWEAGHRGLRKSHRPGVLSGGATFTATQASPSDSQALESRKWQTLEIARAFRVPPYKIGELETGAARASVEQQNQEFQQDTLRPLAERIERAYQRLLPAERSFLEFDFRGILRADSETRARRHSTLVQAGVLSVDEARSDEGLAPLPDGIGAVPRGPLANIELYDAGVVGDRERAQIAGMLVREGFDPSAVLAWAGLPNLPHNGLPSVQQQLPEQGDKGDGVA